MFENLAEKVPPKIYTLSSSAHHDRMTQHKSDEITSQQKMRQMCLCTTLTHILQHPIIISWLEPARAREWQSAFIKSTKTKNKNRWRLQQTCVHRIKYHQHTKCVCVSVSVHREHQQNYPIVFNGLCTTDMNIITFVWPLKWQQTVNAELATAMLLIRMQ